MLADLHAHYPMHVVTDVEPNSAVKEMGKVLKQPSAYDKFRAFVLKLASRLGNNESFDSGYRISDALLRAGDVGVAFSVLYRPFEEMDLAKRYGAPPDADYFTDLMTDLEVVDAAVGDKDQNLIRVVKSTAELDAAIAAGATALVHCVEGGFHLGNTDAEIERNVATLKARGVAYITVAHLFFRDVATNANALPFLSDGKYDWLFPQRPGVALTPRGEALVKAMVKHRVMVDLSHMREDAIRETLALLDDQDPGRTLPVISSHAGYRFDGMPYMHDAATIEAIAQRGGVIGLIMAQHQLEHGLPWRKTKTLEDTMKVVNEHIRKLREVTGSHKHVGIGSDLDGFIKPTMGGIRRIDDMRALQAELAKAYPADVDRITHGNALRVLRRTWS